MRAATTPPPGGATPSWYSRALVVSGASQLHCQDWPASLVAMRPKLVASVISLGRSAGSSTCSESGNAPSARAAGAIAASHAAATLAPAAARAAAVNDLCIDESPPRRDRR